MAIKCRKNDVLLFWSNFFFCFRLQWKQSERIEEGNSLEFIFGIVCCPLLTFSRARGEWHKELEQNAWRIVPNQKYIFQWTKQCNFRNRKVNDSFHFDRHALLISDNNKRHIANMRVLWQVVDKNRNNCCFSFGAVNHVLLLFVLIKVETR